ncbi:hypothetical protein [Phaeobacter inhibens]|uniref:hypothetical protein n=1 Tax=Phaeobacter inhibens TaxID=221822 RepID=UPI0021A512B7|nr:hypothetical protein [Phaeobacter inhibens]
MVSDTGQNAIADTRVELGNGPRNRRAYRQFIHVFLRNLDLEISQMNVLFCLSSTRF